MNDTSHASSRPPRRSRRGYLCVHLLDDFSGSAKICSEVIALLGEAGEQVTVWVGSAGHTGFIRQRHSGARQFFFPSCESKPLLLAYFIVAQLLLLARTFTYCLVHRPAAVYVSTVAPVGALIGARLACTRAISHVHEVALGTKGLFFVLNTCVRVFATDIICVSRYVASKLHYTTSRCHIVHNSLSAAEWNEATRLAEARNPRHHSEFGVVMACSLKWYKGVDSFLALAAKARQAGAPFRFYLLLNCTREAFASFSASNAAPNLTLVWRPASVYDYYASAHIVLNLSHPEGWIETFGLTMLEAMACGVPVVSPVEGGCLELFEHGSGGWRITSRDIGALFALLRHLSEDPAGWAEASRAARNAALRFSPDAFRRGILAVLAPERVTGNSRPSTPVRAPGPRKLEDARSN